MSKRTRWIVILLAVATGLSVAACLFAGAISTAGDSYPGEFQAIALDTGWLYDQPDGTAAEFDGFQASPSRTPTTIYRALSEQDLKLSALGIGTGYCMVQISLDGEQFFQYGSQQDLDRGLLLGNILKIIPIPDSAKVGSVLAIRFQSNVASSIPNIYAGTSASLLYHFFFQNMGTMVFLITMALMLVILIITACYSRMRPIMQVHYYYLFLFIVFASVWILTDSQLVQLTGASASFVSLLSFEMFMLMIVPFVLFLKEACLGFQKVAFWLCVLLLGNFAVFNVLHFTGVALFPSTLLSTHLCIGVAIAAILYHVISEYRRERTGFSRMMLAGILVLICFFTFQLILFYQEKGLGLNSALFQIGLCIFLVLLALYVVRSLIHLAEEGTRAELYLKLARTDQLTKLYNRMALDDTLENLSNTYTGTIRLGCIVCDLNNLKVTNDTYGHAVGDALLIGVAACLRDAYANRGSIYRTGGDEFYVLFIDTDVDMQTMLRKMDNAIEQYNLIHAYPISCARGAAVDYVESGDLPMIYNLLRIADDQMYAHKSKTRRGACPQAAQNPPDPTQP